MTRIKRFDFDGALKDLFQRQPSLFLMKLTGGVAVKEFLNVELPRVPNRKVDLLLRLVDGTLLHIEFQSRNDRHMAIRMAEYYYWLVRKYDCAVRQIVIYTGDKRLTMKTRFDRDGNFHLFELIDLRDVSAAELLQSSLYVDNVLAFLAGGPESKRKRIRSILSRVGDLPPEEREQALALLGALSGLRNSEIMLEREATKMALFEWKKSRILRKIHEEGLEEGREQGREEGLEQGLKQGFRKMLTHVLHSYGRMPRWAEKRIAEAPYDQLEKWAANFPGANSVEDVIGPRSAKS